MQLSFDPRDRNAAQSALAVILALHPDIETDNRATITVGIGGDFASLDEALDSFDEGGTQAERLLERDAPDPAQAFGAAPTIPQPPVPLPNPGGVEVDAAGLPWDARIHSGPADKKPRNGDQTWRRKRGADDALVAQVEAELRAALGAPAAGSVPAAPIPPAPAPVPAPPAAIPVAPAPIPAPPVPVPTPEPAATASISPVVTTAPSEAPAADFAGLMRKITARQTAGVLTIESTAALCAALGIAGIRDLVTRPDLVPSFDALLPPLAS